MSIEWTLYVYQKISAVRIVEADTFDEAVDEFYQEGMPGVMFVDHTFPDEGEWEVDEMASRIENGVEDV